MRTVSLNGQWEIVERPVTDGPECVATVLAAPATLSDQVPGDVNDALVQAGRLPEPLVGRQFEQFVWVKERSWWFRRQVFIPADWADSPRLELSLDGLDVEADVWFNGCFLGHHRSSFYPLVREVTAVARPGAANTLLVRLTTGFERVPTGSDFPLLEAVPTEASRGFPERGFKQRIYLRKPAYVWGWDWGPHLPTCGITGNAELRCHARTEIADVALRTSLDGDTAIVAATIELLHHTLTASAWADLELRLTDADGHAHEARVSEVFVASGVTLVELSVVIPRARLWWPNGSGEQHRYTVTVSARIDGETVTAPAFPYGVRTVELVVKPEQFHFRLNGQPIFLKGGNWCPPDALYGRITDARVTRLIEEAAAAHFNCLRIWGGGRFETDAFYEACDRLGILIWQDFMSACAPLPAHEGWFVDEFRSEASYQLHRLHNRACLALWCGNNEVSGCYHWFKQAFDKHRDPGWMLYHELLPRLVRQLHPHVPYWPTSPYGGADTINNPRVGDDHHWVVMSPRQENWSNTFYWDEPSIPIFNSEYGYGGPCCLESTRQYLGVQTPNLLDDLGRQHTNTFYDIPRVNFSIGEHYRPPEGLPLADYILLGGLCQGLNLGYSLESLRANDQTMGGIFWMYDDTWGENGWSIVDYYLRRKVSYYEVKRRLAPVRLVLRPGGKAFGGKDGEVLLLGLNETPGKVAARVNAGYLSYDGSNRDLLPLEITLAPRSRATLATFPRPDAARLAAGTVVAWPEPGSPLEPVSWKHCRYKEMNLPPASVNIVRTAATANGLAVTVRANGYAHAFHLDLPGDWRCSDAFFDLLPGEERTIVVHDLARPPAPLCCRWVNQ